MSYILLYE
ncbi:hypothetical protein PENPOL_c034G09633 [Penicillium polonicum]|uniref:Uncharacterized protein n=1 Tax=Penicillium polonicum TaxID=60169 RepID=A0A1V6N5J4_PENPO|nr:hypothetical protein PENPOL_c034G09633 [Penicillium polonicum]